jgi:hypothetical protein
MNFKILPAAFAILLSACAADAAVVTLTWVNPTENTDNTPIPAQGAGALISNRVEYGSCAPGGQFGAAVGSDTIPVATTWRVVGLIPGTEYCYRVFAVNSFGVESAASNVVAKRTDLTTPKSPTLIKAE